MLNRTLIAGAAPKIALFTVLAVNGCGPSTGTSDGGAAGTSGGGGAAATGGAGGGSGTGGTTSTGGTAAGGGGAAGNVGASGGAGSGGSAGGPGGAGGGQGGNGADDRLLPLELGRRWTFQQTAINATQPANCSRAESSVVSRASFGGQSGWTYAPTCSDQNADVLINGDDIAFYSSAAHLETERFDYATAPVQDGRIWTTMGNRYTWRDAGAVQTPAGRFDRCWQRNAMSADTYIVLCRGTGLVVVNSPSSNYRLELMTKNF